VGMSLTVNVTQAFPAIRVWQDVGSGRNWHSSSKVREEGGRSL
jgi:hypothetical protein